MPAFRILFIALSCLLLATSTACRQPSATLTPATFTAAPLRGDPQIVVSTINDTLVVDITSPTGIGSAAIEKTAGQWPGKIVLRFHLSGLEEMKFHYGDTTLQVNVSSHGDNAVTETLVKNGETTALSPGDPLYTPYWMNVQILNADGATGTIPLQNGAIDVSAPPDFFRSGATKFTLEWIDFYR